MGGTTIYYGCAELKPAGENKWEGGGYTARGVYGMTVIQKNGKNVVIDLPEAKDLAKYASVFIESGGTVHFFNSKGTEVRTGKKDLEYYKKQLSCTKDTTAGERRSTATADKTDAPFIKDPDKYLHPQCDLLVFELKQDLIEDDLGHRFKDGTCSYSFGGETYLGTAAQCSEADKFEAQIDAIFAQWRPKICAEMKAFDNKHGQPADLSQSCTFRANGLTISSQNKEACGHYLKAGSLEASRDAEISKARAKQITYIKQNMRHVTDVREKSDIELKAAGEKTDKM